MVLGCGLGEGCGRCFPMAINGAMLVTMEERDGVMQSRVKCDQ